MKIRYKILLSILCVVTLLITVVTITYRDSMSVNYYRKRNVEIEAQLVALTDLRAGVRNQMLEAYEVAFVEGYRGHEGDVPAEKEHVRQKFLELEKVYPEGSKADVLVVLRAEYQQVDQGLDAAIRLAAAGRLQEAKQTIYETRELKFNRGFIKGISDVIERQQGASQEGSLNLEQSIVNLQTMLISLTGFAILLAVALVMFTSRSLGDRLIRLENATRKIGKGDFDIALSVRGSDELSLLSSAFNHMAAALQDAKLKLVRQQELIMHSSKMSALGEMAGSVAHEINSPLAVIGLRAEQMEECLKRNEFRSGDFLDGLAVIRKTVDRIARIVSGLRFFAGDARNSLPEKVSLPALIQDTLAFCREKFVKDSVEFELVMDDAINATEIECRPVEVSQVILNLLNNACDAVATNANEKKKWVRLSVRNDNDVVQMTVTDSGPGVPRDLQDKIMQPFFTTKSIGKGTGLGLSISKGIMDEHGGSLYYDPKARHTSFTIVLPKVHQH